MTPASPGEGNLCSFATYSSGLSTSAVGTDCPRKKIFENDPSSPIRGLPTPTSFPHAAPRPVVGLSLLCSAFRPGSWFRWVSWRMRSPVTMHSPAPADFTPRLCDGEGRSHGVPGAQVSSSRGAQGRNALGRRLSGARTTALIPTLLIPWRRLACLSGPVLHPLFRKIDLYWSPLGSHDRPPALLSCPSPGPGPRPHGPHPHCRHNTGCSRLLPV